MGAPLHCYTCGGGCKILENWGKAEPKACCDVMVEAVDPTDCIPHQYWVYKKFEHLHMQLMGIWVHPYTVIPVMVGGKFWKIGVKWSPNDIVVSWLRLKTPADCIPHQYLMYTRSMSLTQKYSKGSYDPSNPVTGPEGR
jgi:hypothetical protein